MKQIVWFYKAIQYFTKESAKKSFLPQGGQGKRFWLRSDNKLTTLAWPFNLELDNINFWKDHLIKHCSQILDIWHLWKFSDFVIFELNAFSLISYTSFSIMTDPVKIWEFSIWIWLWGLDFELNSLKFDSRFFKNQYI